MEIANFLLQATLDECKTLMDEASHERLDAYYVSRFIQY